jgi:ribonuclease BN (tRNA processing enzyme)
MSMESIAAQIEREVLSWPNVTAHPHRFGGVEFQVNQHEIGHLHGDHLADLPFPVRMRRELVADGRASPHHILPDTGWVSYYIRSAADLAGAITLFRLNYDRLTGGNSAAAGGKGVSAADQVIEESFPASDPPPGPVTLP